MRRLSSYMKRLSKAVFAEEEALVGGVDVVSRARPLLSRTSAKPTLSSTDCAGRESCMYRWYFQRARASPVRVVVFPPAVTATSVGLTFSQASRSLPASAAGGTSFRSRRVRSSATRCWFSWSASVRVA